MKMRLIDGVRLVKKLLPQYKELLGTGVGDGMGMVLAEICAAPAVEAAPRWIPVTERLPDKDTIVLCYKGGDWRLGYYIGAEYSKEVAAFRHPKDQFAFGVTHWMPLPQPPEMNGGTDHED